MDMKGISCKKELAYYTDWMYNYASSLYFPVILDNAGEKVYDNREFIQVR